MMVSVHALKNAVCAVAFMPALLITIAVFAHSAEDVLIADFEGKDYGAWTVVGEAFGPGPAQGTMPRQMAVSGYQGKGLVNSFYQGDNTTGTLTSPEFTINRAYQQFLFGGGGTDGKTCMNLLMDGKVARTATGPNKKPGGSEKLDPMAWDVSDLQSKKARIQIVDMLTGGWGHINVDQIALSDKKPVTLLVEQRRDIMIEKRYLNFPVKTGAPKRKVSVIAGGEAVREFDIELADAANGVDFWVALDVAAFKGKTLSIKADKLLEGSEALKLIEQGDALKGAENLYREALRPQFHFSTRRGWNNDPNGLVFHKGEYHLYYQYNPYGWAWGNMHWGHAVSKDLVHWEELPIAIYPKQFGDWVFSGSAVIDKDNTAGFKKGGEDVMVAAFTSTGRGESIAYSNDRGRTFTDYEGNPVVKHKGRDPKVIWHEPSKQWVMALYDEFEGKKWIAFYTASDLKNWTYQSRIEGFFECPEFFEIALDGGKDRKDNKGGKDLKDSKKWVAYAANGEYVVGAFDGKAFAIEQPKQRYNYGNCFYASQAYNNIPPEDGRCIQIGWGQVKTPGMPFNQLMLFPCELTLRKTAEGYRLYSMPVKEIESLHGKKHSWKNEPIKPEPQPLKGIEGELLDISADFAPGEAEELGLNIRDATITYNAKKQELSCQGKTAPLPMRDGKIQLRILVDRTTIEIFANDGAIYMPIGAVPKDGAPKAHEIFAKGAGAKILAMDIYELNSIWKP
ncbi:MAG: glycoside hydrolase family 32 protein [Candidatus Sumerlaeota bacterium]|nr:glycoside hydrolase family 32 protein [Candidatus Sumerlaeota bacterium]